MRSFFCCLRVMEEKLLSTLTRTLLEGLCYTEKSAFSNMKDDHECMLEGFEQFL